MFWSLIETYCIYTFWLRLAPIRLKKNRKKSQKILISFYLKKQERGSNIFGTGARSKDDYLPYMKLSFANGPAYKPKNSTKRKDPTLHADKMNDFSYESPAAVPKKDETHGGDDVVIFAKGPHSHMFTGSMEQHTIPHFMAYAACIGDGITYCQSKQNGIIS